MPSKASQYRECRLPEQTGTGSLFSVGQPTRQEHQSPRTRIGVQSSLERQRRNRARSGTLRSGRVPPPPRRRRGNEPQQREGPPSLADRPACSSKSALCDLEQDSQSTQRLSTRTRVAREGGEPVDKPGSVASNHSSRAVVADCLVRPTRDRRGPRHRPPIWPCSRRECLAGPVARARGALLPHPFTLAGRANGWRSALCCTCRRLAPPRDYLAPCPVEPGLSSSRSCAKAVRLDAGRRRAVA